MRSIAAESGAVKPKPKIVIGTPDPEALQRPHVARYQPDEFRAELMKGMAEAKEAALRRQAETDAEAPTLAKSVAQAK